MIETKDEKEVNPRIYDDVVSIDSESDRYGSVSLVTAVVPGQFFRMG